jgi:hypothetical protein
MQAKSSAQACQAYSIRSSSVEMMNVAALRFNVARPLKYHEQKAAMNIWVYKSGNYFD